MWKIWSYGFQRWVRCMNFVVKTRTEEPHVKNQILIFEQMAHNRWIVSFQDLVKFQWSDYCNQTFYIHYVVKKSHLGLDWLQGVSGLIPKFGEPKLKFRKKNRFLPFSRVQKLVLKFQEKKKKSKWRLKKILRAEMRFAYEFGLYRLSSKTFIPYSI